MKSKKLLVDSILSLTLLFAFSAQPVWAKPAAFADNQIDQYIDALYEIEMEFGEDTPNQLTFGECNDRLRSCNDQANGALQDNLNTCPDDPEPAQCSKDFFEAYEGALAACKKAFMRCAKQHMGTPTGEPSSNLR